MRRQTGARDWKGVGWWQFAVFGLSLVLAWLVWRSERFREPEESRVGYTASGCYERARKYMNDAKLTTDRYSKARAYVSATRYLEALEERFGVSVSRWDAYEMLGDAGAELAGAFESDRRLAERLRLRPVAESRRLALRAYRAAAVRLRQDSPDGPRLLRKQSEMLLALGRPGEAFAILRDLVKLYRRDEVDRLRREREGGLPALATEAPAELTDEARTVYFLAGRAALEAARSEEVRLKLQDDAETRALAETFKGEAVDDFTLFLDAGGSGKRLAEARTALGDLAFERAETETPGKAIDLLKDARDHYASAGTPEAAFLLARVLFRMGEYVKAQKSFAGRRDGMSTAERRARSYMEARCLLAAGETDEAAKVFGRLRTDNPEDAEGASSLVGLAEVALAAGRLDEAARHLLGAAAPGPPRPVVELPERDRELERPRLARRLVEIAEALEREGKIESALEIYRKSLNVDPGRRSEVLGRIAHAWERKAGIDRASGASGARAPGGLGPGEALVSAAKAYLELADVLPAGEARREALRIAAEHFHRGGSVARAIEVAHRFVREHPEDELTSRMLHHLGSWEHELGLLKEANEHLAENVRLHWSDVYADRSLLERARLLVSRGLGEDLLKARGLLKNILEGEFARRYGEKTLVRLGALFLLGRVDMRLAERETRDAERPGALARPTDPGPLAARADSYPGAGSSGEALTCAGRNLLREALDVLGEVVSRHPPEKYPAKGEGARPRFRALVDRERPGALVARGAALYGLGRFDEARKALGEAREEARRRGQELLAGPERDTLEDVERTAALYEALADCRMRRAGDPAVWPSARDALASLTADARTRGILSAGYWRNWSAWIVERAGEGKTDGGTD